MRIATDPLLQLQCEPVHPAAHVRHTARDPDPHSGRKRCHRGSGTASRAARCAGVSETGIVLRHPFVSVMSIRVSSPSREGRCAGAGRALSIASGTKPTPGTGAARAALRYPRRQIESRDREIPYRRAVAEPGLEPRRLSSTIRTLSASDPCRRRPASSVAKISTGETTEAHTIGQCPRPICTIRPDGPHCRHIFDSDKFGKTSSAATPCQ